MRQMLEEAIIETPEEGADCLVATHLEVYTICVSSNESRVLRLKSTKAT